MAYRNSLSWLPMVASSTLLVLIPLLLVNQLAYQAEACALVSNTDSLESALFPQVNAAQRFGRSLLQVGRKKGMHKGKKGMHKPHPITGKKPGGHIKAAVDVVAVTSPIGVAWDLSDLVNGPMVCTTDLSMAETINGITYLRILPGHIVGGKLRSVNRYQYGRFEFSAKTPSKNSGGLISTFYLSTRGGRHDEIDLEFKRSGELTRLQTNWFACGKGGNEFEPQINFKAYEAFHNYAIDWQPNKIEFIIDGAVVQTVNNNGGCFPSEPMYVYLTVWHASWAGPIDWGTDHEFELEAKNVVVKPVNTFAN